jgi:negative regulator of sigma E activity
MLLPRHPFAVDRGLAERNYDARRTGTTTLAGRSVQAVEVVPKGGGRPVWRLWLDRQNSFALKRERYSVDGVMTTSSEFTSVDFHAQVDPSMFDIPSGYARTGQGGEETRLEVATLERQLGFSVHRPRYVPAAYTLLGGYVRREREGLRALRGSGGDSAELRYTDGIRILSIVQRPAAPRGAWREPRRGRSEVMDLSNRGSEKALRYNTPDRVIVVVGDLTQEELARVAKGVE